MLAVINKSLFFKKKVQTDPKGQPPIEKRKGPVGEKQGSQAKKTASYDGRYSIFFLSVLLASFPQKIHVTVAGWISTYD